MTTLLGATPSNLVRGQLVQGLKWSIEVITENGGLCGYGRAARRAPRFEKLRVGGLGALGVGRCPRRGRRSAVRSHSRTLPAQAYDRQGI